MTVRSLVFYPNQVLRHKSKDVKELTSDIKNLIADMIDTMQENNGIGIAAIQVGTPLRIFVIDQHEIINKPQEVEELEAEVEDIQPPIDEASEERLPPIIAINPEITCSSEETLTYTEGCLSIPDAYAEITRPEKITLRYTNLENEIIEVELSGLLAVCAQHELDHLNGILFIDHLSKLKRDRLLAKRKKQSSAK